MRLPLVVAGLITAYAACAPAPERCPDAVVRLANAIDARAVAGPFDEASWQRDLRILAPRPEQGAALRCAAASLLDDLVKHPRRGAAPHAEAYLRAVIAQP